MRGSSGVNLGPPPLPHIYQRSKIITQIFYCKSFADDTCIIYQSKKLKTLESDLNHDPKLCSEWLNANRLSLNVDKTKLLLFHSKKKKMDYEICIKINGSKLNPSGHVKYFRQKLSLGLPYLPIKQQTQSIK